MSSASMPAGRSCEAEAPSEGRRREELRLRHARDAMTEGSPGWEYLLSRGFTDGEIRRFGFGYEPGRVTIPWMGCPWYHTDRAIGDAGRRYLKPPTSRVGPQPIFNEAALDADVAFLVEGPLDAYAIEAVGGDAIALAGTSWRPVAAAAKGRHATLVALLDADEAGRAACAEMVRALRNEGANVTEATLPGGAKDACELLATDRDALAAFVGRTAGSANRNAAAALMVGLGAHAATDVAFGIAVLEEPVEPTPTGLASLDEAVGGGLRPGLTVLGAAPSVGKTTLATQIADNVARSGVPVLYVTLEQTAAAIVAKGLSRELRTANGLSVPASELLSARARSGWVASRSSALAEASASYARDVAGNLWVIDEGSRPTLARIREAARALAGRGPAPLVVIDYLQLLAQEAAGDGLSDKQAVDRVVSGLRGIAGVLGACVLAVSSLNRAGYAGRAGQRAFKESGLIEYGADLLLTLDAPAAPEGSDRRATAMRPIEARVLKNRDGPLPGRPVRLLLDSRSSLYVDPRCGICATYMP